MVKAMRNREVLTEEDEVTIALQGLFAVPLFQICY